MLLKYFGFVNAFLTGVCVTMPWPTRIKIALGAAKGLAFLHAAERPIIYRDFKTSNILLDAVCASLYVISFTLDSFFAVSS